MHAGADRTYQHAQAGTNITSISSGISVLENACILRSRRTIDRDIGCYTNRDYSIQGITTLNEENTLYTTHHIYILTQTKLYKEGILYTKRPTT